MGKAAHIIMPQSITKQKTNTTKVQPKKYSAKKNEINKPQDNGIKPRNLRTKNNTNSFAEQAT